MTNNEFWNLLEIYARSPQTQTKIPPLILQANTEKLSVLVVTRNRNMNILNVQDKSFAHLVTRFSAQVPDVCIVGETELDGFFFQLIDSGYHGIAFTIDNTLIGVEWSDLFPTKPIAMKKRK